MTDEIEKFKAQAEDMSRRIQKRRIELQRNPAIHHAIMLLRSLGVTVEEYRRYTEEDSDAR